jgi:hypothetical protein
VTSTLDAIMRPLIKQIGFPTLSCLVEEKWDTHIQRTQRTDLLLAKWDVKTGCRDTFISRDFMINAVIAMWLLRGFADGTLLRE